MVLNEEQGQCFVRKSASQCFGIKIKSSQISKKWCLFKGEKLTVDKIQ